MSAATGHTLDFSTLPFPIGPLLPSFEFESVDFTRIWDSIQHEASIKLGRVLYCRGSQEELPPGSGLWHDAKVKLDFYLLPFQVSKILARVLPGGIPARLVGKCSDGKTKEVMDDGEAVIVLELTTSPDRPFISATLSGQEAHWMRILLE